MSYLVLPRLDKLVVVEVTLSLFVVCQILVLMFNSVLFVVGTKFPVSSLKDQQVRAHWEVERQNMYKILHEYLLLCCRMGVIFFLVFVSLCLPFNCFSFLKVYFLERR